MSENIPFEIQLEIMKRLPVKSLIQFRSVSKAWKSLIDSSDFIARYSGQMHHLFIKYHEFFTYEPKYVSIVHDDTFPQQRVSPTIPIPPLLNMLKYVNVIGSSHGLLCLYGYCRDDCDCDCDSDTALVVIWNISIRKAVAIVVPNVGNEIYETILGFGVCSEMNDPKIVKITQINRSSYSDSISSIPRQVEVFMLSAGVWRSLCSNLPRKSIELFGSQVVIDECIYWLAMNRSIMDSGFMSYNLIISFDLKCEEFKEVNLPDTLAHDRSDQDLSMFKLRESLVVLERVEDETGFIVWRLEDGVSKSFTKLFTIYAPNATILGVLEFRKSGEPIVEIEENDSESDFDSSLAVYEPCSKHIKGFGINGTDTSFSVSLYVETLLLLNQPNFIIYGKDKSCI